MSAPEVPTDLKTTPLTAWHGANGGKLVAFAGYSMPVQYAGESGGVLKEHLWTRAHAGIFDVSHMGQARLRGVAPLAAFEEVVPGDYIGLKPGRQKYSILLNRTGGIIDDLMAGRPDDDGLFVVVNGACKDNDFKVIDAELAGQVTIERLEDRALIAVQGPEAAAVVQGLIPGTADMVFMDIRSLRGLGADLIVSRSGYTGEDGYEISVPAADAVRVWETLAADPRVRPIGLGARDSLRLEAGLPLYGHDLDETVSPVEAGLTFAINKNRREQRDFPGAARIARELAEGPARAKVALRVLEGAPAREGAEVADAAGAVIGVVTSGGYSPTLKAGVALAFVTPEHKALGTKLAVIVRGKPQACEVVASPFVPHRYVRKAAP
ncbi:MAG: glycine cleavage system aminomethyltransferase GcvT [Phenylobacterium sp.]|nr:MAG: glycine cleavage system aminomethyltransferase GcvT [Phenylobacterium sp.]